MKNIAIITGGDNAEREISLRSAGSVEKTLLKAGYTVDLYDFPSDTETFLAEYKTYDFCFIMIHGRGGEDGKISAFLETLGVPYQGCASDIHAICMDKSVTKAIRKQAKLPVARDMLFSISSLSSEDFGKRIERFETPCVIKAVDEGSTRGISFCFTHEDIAPAYTALAGYDKLLVEEYLSGREFTVGLLDIQGKTKILPIIEIIPPEGGVFDYENKYNGKTQEICPAEIDDTLRDEIQKLAFDGYRAVGCTGYGRVDIILDKKEKPHLIEINTIPGFTDQSLFPQQAKVAGIDFLSLLEGMMEE